MFSITGHTRGLGKALCDKIPTPVLGFSRSNGYDIRLQVDRSRIIDEVSNCDIFINCAYCGDDSQTTLLYELYSSWKNKDKLIINIGSETTSGIKKKEWMYTAHKSSLHKASEQLSYLNNPCKVVNFKFGYIGVERVLKTYNPKEYILPEHAAQFILDNINAVKQHRLTELLLRP